MRPFFEGLRAGTRGPRLGRPQADTLQEGQTQVLDKKKVEKLGVMNKNMVVTTPVFRIQEIGARRAVGGL